MWPGACREDPKKEVMNLCKLFKCYFCKTEKRNEFHAAMRGSRVCSFSENGVGVVQRRLEHGSRRDTSSEALPTITGTRHLATASVRPDVLSTESGNGPHVQ